MDLCGWIVNVAEDGHPIPLCSSRKSFRSNSLSLAAPCQWGAYQLLIHWLSLTSFLGHPETVYPRELLGFYILQSLKAGHVLHQSANGVKSWIELSTRAAGLSQQMRRKGYDFSYSYLTTSQFSCMAQSNSFPKSTHSENLTIWLLRAVFVASLGPICWLSSLSSRGSLEIASPSRWHEDRTASVTQLLFEKVP